MSSSKGEREVLIVTDPQLDFCPGGALATPGGNEIIPISIGWRGALPM